MNEIKEKLKSRKFIFFIAFCLIAFIILNLNAGFAKYISSTNGNISVNVAKFSFVVKDGSNTLSSDFTYDLAAHVTDGTNLSTSGLCPGKSGQIDITIDMSGSEVATGYSVYLDTENTLPDNLKFYSDAAMTNEINLGSSSALTGTINLSDINTPVHPIIYFKWVWDETDNENTFEGKSLLMNIKVAAWQYVGA